MVSGIDCTHSSSLSQSSINETPMMTYEISPMPHTREVLQVTRRTTCKKRGINAIESLRASYVAISIYYEHYSFLQSSMPINLDS